MWGNIDEIFAYMWRYKSKMVTQQYSISGKQNMNVLQSHIGLSKKNNAISQPYYVMKS